MSVPPAASFAAFQEILRNAGSARPELESLSRERDPELFYRGLLSFAGRQETRGRVDLAGQIYTALGGAEPPFAAVAERARRRLDAIVGRGAMGPRVEHLMRGFLREAASPAALIGMGGAQAVFGFSRMAFLSRLIASPSAGFLTRGFGARALASSAAFALEAPSFVGFVRGANLAMGVEQDWSREALSREIAGSFLTLGALKLGGALGTSLHRRALGPQASAFSQGLFHQTSMLGGILVGHGLETRLGIRESVDDATSLTDALVLLLQFHVSGRLLNSALGPRWAAYQRDLHLASERLGAGGRPRNGGEPGEPGLAWALAASGGVRDLARGGLSDLMSRPMAMASNEGRGGVTPFQSLVKSLLRPQLQSRARDLLVRLRNSPSPSELLPDSRSLEVAARSDLEGLWTPTWKIGVNQAQWRSLTREVARKLASHFPEEAVDRPLVQAAGIAMYRELRELRKGGLAVGAWTRFLGKVSASDLRALLDKYPRHIVFATLQLSPERVMESVPNFQHRYDISFEEAQSLLPEAYRTEILARTIASQAYRAGDPREMARLYIEKWRRVHGEALSWLRGVEGLEERADTLARQTVHLSDPLPVVRRRALQLLIGADPREAVSRLPNSLRLHRVEARVEEGIGRDQLIASLDEALNGSISARLREATGEERELLSTALEEMARQVRSPEEVWELARIFEEMDLKEGGFGDWESVSEFLPEGFSFQSRGGDRIPLFQRELIQQAPVFQDRGELLSWLLKNKTMVDRLAGADRRFTFPSIVRAMSQAGRLEGSVARYETLGQVLEFEYQLGLGPEVSEILPPSESFSQSLQALRRYSIMLKALETREAEQRRGEGPTREAQRVVYMKDHRHLAEALDPILEGLDGSRRYLRIHISGSLDNGWMPLVERVKAHPTLREVRLFYPDGAIKAFVKTEAGVVESAQAQEVRYRPEEIESVRAITPWSSPRRIEKFPALVERLRSESHFMLRDVAELMSALEGAPRNQQTPSRYEQDAKVTPEWPALQSLARIYGVDVRELVYSSNRTRFPRLPVRDWTASHYPLYLEGQSDLERVRHYSESDPSRQSLGWLIFSARKNPFCYLGVRDLAERTGLSASALRDLELNESKPNRHQILRLAEALDLSPSRIAAAASRTHDRDLAPVLEALFPGQTIYVDDAHHERGQIQSYVASRDANGNPSIGQILFGQRHGAGFFSSMEYGERLGLPTSYWDHREANRIGVERHNWHEWVGLFQKAGIPLDRLRPFLEPLGIREEGAAYQVALGMEGSNVLEVADRAGVSATTLHDLMKNPASRPEPEAILSLHYAMPRLDARGLYRQIHPSVLQFFPELESGAPQLGLESTAVDRALRWDVRRLLFRHRMENGIDKKAMGGRLGITGPRYDQLERLVTDVRDEVLLEIGRELKIDSRELYLRYRPWVLGIYPPAEGREPLAEPAFQELRRTWQGLHDESNMRRRLWGVLNRRRLIQDGALAEALGDPALARRLGKLDESLSVEEILRLKDVFPELSAREWYEHFNGPRLDYFLGRGEDGAFDYRAPSPNLRDPKAMLGHLRETMVARDGSMRQSSFRLGLHFLRDANMLRKGLEARNWQEETMARVSQGLGIERRLLFHYFRASEWEAMEAADQGSTSPGKR